MGGLAPTSLGRKLDSDAGISSQRALTLSTIIHRISCGESDVYSPYRKMTAVIQSGQYLARAMGDPGANWTPRETCRFADDTVSSVQIFW